MHEDMKVEFSGSGGLFGGKSNNEKNTLRSNATAVFIDILAEGEIKGLVNDDKGIYFGETPLKSPDDTVNFKGVEWQQRFGTPDQDPFPGANATTEVSVNVEVKKTAAISRNLTDSDYTSARVTMRIPALFFQDDDDGKTKGATVKFNIEVRYQGGAWESPFGEITITGKCTSPYDKSFWFPLPKNPSGASDPWTIRVTRITDDTDEIERQDDTYWLSYAAIIDERLTYPDTALLGMSIDADKFGQTVPDRMYLIEGRLSPVPSNYDPLARTYTGIWDGTFVTAYHNNPAWAFYDMLTNTRFGLGEFTDPNVVDKWTLYTIGRYCDELVPDGYGSYEPRFTINGYFTEQDDAYEFMQMMASIFRGITYWSSGLVTASQDAPINAELLVTPQNVEGGIFNYSSSALNVRHSVVEVTWKDPNDLYRDVVEVVRDTDAVLRYGVRIKKVTATACTSRGQARRIGRWILFTEQVETQALNYVAGLDHSFLRPGSVIEVMDKEVSNVDFSGRIVSQTVVANELTEVVLDRPVTLEAGHTYQFAITSGDMSTVRGTVTTGAGDTDTLQLSGCSSAAGFVAGAIWLLSHEALEPKYYRVITIEEKALGRYEIGAIEHQPGKYDNIDYGADFDPPVTRHEVVVTPPTNATALEYQYYVDGNPRSAITFSWTAPTTLSFPKYDVVIENPDGDKEVLRNYAGVSYTLEDTKAGDYLMTVETVAINGGRSTALDYTFSAVGWTVEEATVLNLSLADLPGQTVFRGRSPRFKWDGRVGGATAPLNTSLVKHYIVKVYDDAEELLLRTDTVTDHSYTYDYEMNVADNAGNTALASRSLRLEVQLVTVHDLVSAASTLSVSNPAPEAPTIVLTPSMNMIGIVVSSSLDVDYAGTKIWVSTSSPPNTGLTPDYDGPATSFVFGGPTDTTYYVKAGQYDVFSSTVVNFSIVYSTATVSIVDITPPGTPTGLSLSTDLVGGIPRLYATWDANTEGDFAGYDVEISENGGGYVGFFTNLPNYQWVVKSGVSYTVRVRAKDKLGNTSAYSGTQTLAGAADSTPPSTPTGLSATAGFNVIWLSWAANTEADLSHYELFEQATSTPAPTAGTAATFVSSGTTMAREGLGNGVQKYYWLRAVDTSGNKSSWTASVNATTVYVGGGDISIPAPGTPSAPTATTVTVITPAGDVSTTMEVSLSIVADAVAYDVGITPYGGNESFFTVTAGRRLAVPAVPGVSYAIRARAINSVGTVGTYSTTTNYTVTGDAAAPATPTGLAVVAGFNTLWLSWAENPENDLWGYELFEQATATPAPTAGSTASFSLTATSFARTGLANSVTRYYWIRAVDTTGNKSAWSSSVNATTVTIGSADIVGAVNVAAFAAGVTPVEIVSSLPGAPHTQGRQVFLTTDNKLYRNTGSGWVATVAAADVSGQITGTQITDGAISTPKLSVGAVTANELAANAVTAGKIAAGAVSATEIAAGAVTSDKLSTGELITLTAQIKDAIITDAKIVSITAAKISATWLSGGQLVINSSATYAEGYDPSEKATEEYVQSRGDNLVTNGTGLLGDNTNFSSFTADGSDTYSATMAFTHTGSANTYLYTDEFIPVDTSKYYRLRSYFRSTGASSVYHFGISMYDIDGYLITAIYHMFIAGTHTTLAAPLRPGDMTISLTDSTNWLDTVGTPTHRCGVIIWGYKNSYGYQYPDYTYSRHIQDNLWAATGTSINRTTHVITLSTPFNVANPDDPVNGEWPAGTKLSNTSSGNTLKYIGGVSVPAPTDWALASGDVGTVDLSGTNVINKFSPGTTKIKIAYLLHFNSTGTNTIKISNADFRARNIYDDWISPNTTVIDPGKILISGSTYLSDWRKGTDLTKIDGGAISANTVTANKLTVGMRGVTISGLEFEHNSPTSNKITWTACTIDYVNDAGSNATVSISANTAGTLWSTGILYVYWVQGETTLSTTTTLATAMASNNVVLASYKGGTDFVAIYGRTIIDGSDIKTGTVTADRLVANSITSSQITTGELITLTAQIKDAIITDAKIAALSAAKLTAGTALAGSITVSGTALSTIQGQAADPATQVNAAATKIDPGKILVSGTTTLADWRNGTDATKIEGGSIATNTIAANKLTIGQRGLSIEGLQFEHNSPSANSVAWTAGSINYVDDSGNAVTANITASNAAWTTGTLYVYWTKSGTTLSTTTSLATAMGANTVILATYKGGTDLVTDYGRTVIDGSKIKTGTITATQIAAAAITADKMNVTDLSAISANMGSIVVGTANIGTLVVGTSNIQNNAVTKYQSATTATNTGYGDTWNSVQSFTSNASFVANKGVLYYTFSLRCAYSTGVVRVMVRVKHGTTVIGEADLGTYDDDVNYKVFNGSFVDLAANTGVSYALEVRPLVVTPTGGTYIKDRTLALEMMVK